MVSTADRVAVVALSWIVPVIAAGRAKRVAQPADHDLLDLGHGGRGLPQHPLRRDGVGQLFGQHRGG